MSAFVLRQGTSEMSDAWIPFFQTLVWALLISGFLALNWRRLGDLLDAIQRRVLRGSAVTLGPFSLGEPPKEFAEGNALQATSEGRSGSEQPPEAPSVFEAIIGHDDTRPLALAEDLYILHQARRLEITTSDGKFWYEVRVWVEADDESILDATQRVTYRLHETFTPRTISTEAREREFELWFRTWGEFTIFAYVERKAAEPAMLSRYLDLPGRPPY